MPPLSETNPEDEDVEREREEGAEGEGSNVDEATSGFIAC